MERPIALVLGDLSLIRALGSAGIPVATRTGRDTPASRSRHIVDIIPESSSTGNAVSDQSSVDQLTSWAGQQQLKPVLFYQSDSDLFLACRYRFQLQEHFHLVLPPSQIAEQLANKAAFHSLAERFTLPVPRTSVLSREEKIRQGQIDEWQVFPVIMKPCHRSEWKQNPLGKLQGGKQKALWFESREALLQHEDLILQHGAGSLLQEAIPGDERAILSYHAYIRADGTIAGEFTGRKLRTYPEHFGHSSYLLATHDERLHRLGASILRRISFRGVAKLDFKRDPRTGRDYLLEINPRFNLWHHLGAACGINLPAMVYGDLTGVPTEVATSDSFQSFRWMATYRDFRAIASQKPNWSTWAHWFVQVLTAEVNEDIHLSDPLPALHDLSASLRRKMAKMVRGPGGFGTFLPAPATHPSR